MISGFLKGKVRIARQSLSTMACLAAVAIPVVIGLSNAPSCQAQSQTGPKPSFEVVSIKEAADCGMLLNGVKMKIPGRTTYGPGGRYTACSQLKLIIMDAYRIQSFSPIAGVPDWNNDILYKIEAKAEGNPGEEQMHLMVQSMIEDRFKLKMHRETHEAPIYSLVVAKGGPKLQPAMDENGNLVASLPTPEERQKKMKERQSGKSYSLDVIISNMLPGDSIDISTKFERKFICKAINMKSLATKLNVAVGGLKVNDKTGLTGYYDLQLNFAPQDSPSVTDPVLSPEPSAPTVFKALQDQLGLKLESGKEPMDHFYIDSVEKPSEN
jgi:uncharacterized protein (TIGR03435 family)